VDTRGAVGQEEIEAQVKIHAHFDGRILCGAPMAVAKNVPLEYWMTLPDNKTCKRCAAARVTPRRRK
jgi:hypothetical protein